MALFHTTVLDNQIKALPTVDTASGAIANFDTDLTENLVEVKCQIVAKQASGTPSPDNPLPIGVYDSLTLYHNDINMWDEQWEVGGFNSVGLPTSVTDRIRSKNFIPVKPDITVYRKSPNNIQIMCYNKNKNFVGLVGWWTGNAVLPADTYYIKFQVDPVYGTTYNHDISINYPSSDTQYHAFNGAYIPFGQIVANGVIDITTGKLSIEMLDCDLSSLTWNNADYGYYSSGLSATIKRTTSIGDIPNLKAEKYATTSRTNIGSTGSNNITVSTQGNLLCSSSSTPTGHIVYELATPQEIQLDSTQITALLNENNVWCDTGDTEVKFLLTVGKKIS